jgi:hypothetical protein
MNINMIGDHVPLGLSNVWGGGGVGGVKNLIDFLFYNEMET